MAESSPNRDSPESPDGAADGDASAGSGARAAAPGAASAGTGTPTAPGDASPGPAPTGLDVGRRRFFRQFATELVQTAATVMNAATALQRTSAEAAGVLLDPAGAGERLAVDPTTGTPVRAAVFRTAFRLEGESLILVDQRRLPEQVVEYECTTAADVAHAIRERVIRGAPAIAQAAALGLSLAAQRMRASQPFARQATLRGSANALINARPTSITLRHAVDRMMVRFEQVGDLSDDGAAVAAALKAEAGEIVYEATAAHGRIAETAQAALPAPREWPLRVLTIGNSGVLAGGQFGTALGVVVAAANAGRDVHVQVCESRPMLQGARLTTWELANAGIPYTLIADAAAPGRLARGEVDVVIVAADRVAANGDVAAVVGTYGLAALAARHGVPFLVCAPLIAVDLDTPDGAALPIEARPASDLLVVRESRIAPLETNVLNPLADVTPAGLVSALITEEGILHAPFEAPLRGAVAAAAARRIPPPAPDADPGAGSLQAAADGGPA